MSFLGYEVGFPTYTPHDTAWLGHGPLAMWLVVASQPRRIVELGSHSGYSYFAFCEAVKQAGLPTACFAVDTWQGDEHAGFYGEEVFDAVQAENAQYSGFSTLIRKTFAEALADIEDGSVDLLHVDGRHFYDDVKEDFESWIPKLSDRAIVLFHDTEVYERGFGVHQYWAELALTRPSINFLHQHGLGLLFWGAQVPEGLAKLTEVMQHPEGRKSIVDFFAHAGGKLAASLELKENPDASPDQLNHVTAQLDRSRTEIREIEAALDKASL